MYVPLQMTSPYLSGRAEAQSAWCIWNQAAKRDAKVRVSDLSLRIRVWKYLPLYLSIISKNVSEKKTAIWAGFKQRRLKLVGFFFSPFPVWSILHFPSFQIRNPLYCRSALHSAASHLGLNGAAWLGRSRIQWCWLFWRQVSDAVSLKVHSAPRAF